MTNKDASTRAQLKPTTGVGPLSKARKFSVIDEADRLSVRRKQISVLEIHQLSRTRDRLVGLREPRRCIAPVHVERRGPSVNTACVHSCVQHTNTHTQLLG